MDNRDGIQGMRLLGSGEVPLELPDPPPLGGGSSADQPGGQQPSANDGDVMDSPPLGSVWQHDEDQPKASEKDDRDIHSSPLGSVGQPAGQQQQARSAKDDGGDAQQKQELINIALSIVPQATEKGTVKKPRSKKSFNDWLGILAEYKRRTGHFNLPRTEPSGLGQFINKIRFEARRGVLSKEKLAKLASIGFVEEARDLDKVWNDRYNELKEFHARHGHYTVSYKVGNQKPLGQWIKCQRAQYQRYLRGQKSKLSAERIQRLEELGLDLAPTCNKVTNAAMMTKLEEYRAKYGNVESLESHLFPASPWNPLASWFEQQKKEYATYKENPSKSKLTKEFVKELREAGVVGSKKKKSKKRARDDASSEGGEDTFAASAAAAATGTAAEEPIQGEAASGAGASKKRKKATARSTKKVREPNVSKKEQTFQQRMIDLREFYSIHGHSRVPQGYPANPSLGHFVNNIRSQYRRREEGKSAPSLTEARLEELAAVDFEFNPRGRRGNSEEEWCKMFRQLEQYKADHGSSNVPKSYPPNPKLAEWIVNQRRAYRQMMIERNGSDASNPGDKDAGGWNSAAEKDYGVRGAKPLSSERQERLQALDFEFAPRGTYKKWEDRLADLEAYKAEFGHCNVPESYTDIPGLANWVRNQTLAYNENKKGGKTALSKTRETKMRNLGFVFERRKEIQREAKKKNSE